MRNRGRERADERTKVYKILKAVVYSLTYTLVGDLSIGSTEDNSQLFCLLHNGYLGVLVH